jgi:hypothetical protein
MGSVSKPRCARGQRCYHVREFHHIDKPPVVSKEGDLCERCSREESDSDQTRLPTYPGYQQSQEEALKDWLEVDRLRLFDSHAARELERLIKDLILELYHRDGPFWETIHDLRARWRISFQVCIPPQYWQAYFHPPGTSKETPLKEAAELSSQWEKNLRSIRDRFIPDRFKRRREYQRRWRDFISRCALFQPPGDDLIGFYLSCGAGPWLDLPEGWEDAKDQDQLAMAEAPIERLRDADRVEAVWKAYYETLIKELGERHLKPAGIDVGEAISDVLESNPALEQRHLKELQEIEKERRPYIIFDEYTAIRDVPNAGRILSRSQEKRPKTGAPTRDPLRAVQYAVLHDERGWTVPQIAERFEGRTDQQFIDRVEDHIADGRTFQKRSPAKN